MADNSVKLHTFEGGIPKERDPIAFMATFLEQVPLVVGGVATTWGAYLRGRGQSSTILASATTTDIGATSTVKVTISGSLTITSLGTVPHGFRLLHFTGAARLAHNGTTLSVQGGADITAAPGDRAIATSDASGNWTVWNYSRVNG